MNRRIRGILLLSAASGLMVFLYLVRGVLTPFVLAAIIAYLAAPLVRTFEARQIPRSVAIFLVYLVFGVFGILTVYLLVPTLVRELNDILTSLPDIIARLERASSGALRWLERIPGPAPIQELVTAALLRLEALVKEVATRTLDVLLSLFSRALYLALAPFLAFYILRDAEVLQHSLLSLVPIRQRNDVLTLIRRLNRVGIGFIRGQLMISGAVGLLIAMGLAVLQVKYALLIGVVAGMFDIIPYFGPVIGGAPAALLGLTRSPATALWVVIWIFVVNQVEAVFLQPHIMGDHVGLHPLTVIFAILSGGSLFGIWGMLLAVPVAAAIKVVVTYIVEKVSTP